MKLSVIIPAWNEEKTIEETLKALLHAHQPDEVLVVDGGSTDQTAAIAGRWGRVLASAKGRARQMNEGARQAAGDILLFLHADSKLPAGGLAKIKEAVGQGFQGGKFQMRFDDNHWLLRIYEVNTRFHFFSYGDQGFFVTRERFKKMGGFREEVPFEDIDFYKRLRQDTRPVIIKDKVVTSARRFTQNGRMKQKMVNFFLVAMYYSGFNVFDFKEKLYPDIR